MLARGIPGSGRTRGVSFRPFPNSSGWWWLIKQLMQIVTMVPGQGGWFQSVCFPSSGESGHPCFVPDFRGNAFNYSPLRIMFVVGLSYIAFIEVC